MRIFYSDNTQSMVDQNTNYSARIKVASDRRATQLIIPEAALVDEKEFFCQVNGMAAGSMEGKTHLRVFGQRPTARRETSLWVIRSLSCIFLGLQLLRRLR